jgi:hypothetical protein
MVNSVDHDVNDLNQLVLDFRKRLFEPNFFLLVLANTDFKLQSKERVLVLGVRLVVSLDDFLGCWVLSICSLESFEEVNVFVDGLGSQISDLIAHQCGDRVEESCCLILVKIFELITEDINSLFGPLRVKHLTNIINFGILPLIELFKRNWMVFWLEEVYEQSLVIILFTPYSHEFQSSL